MTVIYLLYGYEEDGPEDLVATLDRDGLMDLAKADEFADAFRGDGSVRLAEVLAEYSGRPIPPGKYDLLPYGWGGPVLHVVECSARTQLAETLDHSEGQH